SDPFHDMRYRAFVYAPPCGLCFLCWLTNEWLCLDIMRWPAIMNDPGIWYAFTASADHRRRLRAGCADGRLQSPGTYRHRRFRFITDIRASLTVGRFDRSSLYVGLFHRSASVPASQPALHAHS